MRASEEEDYVELTREYLRHNRSLGHHYFELDGHVFEVDDGVFSPEVFGDTEFFAQEVPPRAGKSFLEIGCGAGVIAISVALAGCDRVLATDINPCASANTARNAACLGVDSIVRTRSGDLFDALGEEERFDSIFWNAPFIPIGSTPNDSLEVSVFDRDYRSLQRYLAGAGSHLAAGGRLYFGFSSSSGDLERLAELATELKLELYLCASTEIPDPEHPGFRLELYEARRVPR